MAAKESQEPFSRPVPSQRAAEQKGRSPGEQAARDRLRVHVPAVQAAEEWQRTFDAVPDLIAILDTRHRIVRINQAMADRLGLAKDQCVGQTCYRLVHGTEEPPPFCPHARLLQDGEEHTAEVHEERLAGDFLVSVSPLRDSTGRLVSGIHVARDITERKQAEEELREARDFLENLIGYANVPIIVWNPEGRIIRFNRAFERLTGYVVEEVIGRELTVLFPGPSRAESIAKSARAMGGQYWEWVEVPIRCKNEATRTVLWNSANVYSEDGATLLATIAQGVDITERKRAEAAARNAREELAEQERQERKHIAAELEKVREELVRKTRLAAVGQVSASIAHDLRNPLGSVRNATYYLKRILPKADPRVAEFLGIIDEEIRAADRIINSLLAMTRAREPVKQTVNLARLVTDVFDRSDKPGAVQCRVTTDPDPFELGADPGQLRQLIGNLLENAIDAMGGQGEFIVEAARSTAYDTILIRDTGPGFAREVRQNLFEPLVSTKVKGTGLGLAICRQIAESHGGTIDVADHEGPGAAFEIRLPR